MSEDLRAPAGRRPDESGSHRLVNALLLLSKPTMVVFLEKTTKKTNRNSGLPSSQVDKDETSKGHSGSRGKGPKQDKPATRAS